MGFHRAIGMTCIGLALGIGTLAAQDAVSLFDGKSLSGWEGDVKNTWRVEDGTIAAGSLDQIVPRNEFLATVKEYENFDLKLKYKTVGTLKINAGVQFRTKRIPNHHEVIGYQADIGPVGVAGNLYDESRRKKNLVAAKPEIAEQALAAGKDGWNDLRIRAEGHRIQIWLNGVQTVDFTETEPNIEPRGIIALQIHGAMKGAVYYKDIAILELPSTAKQTAAVESFSLR